MAASEPFCLPDLGEGLTEAEIVAWHVSVGDRVVAGQPLVSVETDKAVVDIPAPSSGVIGHLHGKVGDRLAVGAPLVTFGEAAAASPGVVGRLQEAPQSRSVTGSGVLASPSARQLARELGVDLARVSGTGPDGVIVPADVRSAAGTAARWVTPLRGARRAMAERMADAHARVVPATVTGEADIESWAPGARPLERLVRAVAAAVRQVPRLNAAFDDQRQELRENEAVDLGIAMDTDDGLFVPVLRDVGHREARDFADELDRLQAAVRDRSIAPDRLRGATITLSNFGAVAGWHATMVIVPPQVAIVGAGRAAPRVVADGQRVAVHRVLPLSLTIDHRVVTGAEACRFLAALIDDLQLSQ